MTCDPAELLASATCLQCMSNADAVAAMLMCTWVNKEVAPHYPGGALLGEGAGEDIIGEGGGEQILGE